MSQCCCIAAGCESAPQSTLHPSASASRRRQGACTAHPKTPRGRTTLPSGPPGPRHNRQDHQELTQRGRRRGSHLPSKWPSFSAMVSGESASAGRATPAPVKPPTAPPALRSLPPRSANHRWPGSPPSLVVPIGGGRGGKAVPTRRRAATARRGGGGRWWRSSWQHRPRSLPPLVVGVTATRRRPSGCKGVEHPTSAARALQKGVQTAPQDCSEVGAVDRHGPRPGGWARGGGPIHARPRHRKLGRGRGAGCSWPEKAPAHPPRGAHSHQHSWADPRRPRRIPKRVARSGRGDPTPKLDRHKTGLLAPLFFLANGRARHPT